MLKRSRMSAARLNGPPTSFFSGRCYLVVSARRRAAASVCPPTASDNVKRQERLRQKSGCRAATT